MSRWYLVGVRVRLRGRGRGRGRVRLRVRVGWYRLASAVHSAASRLEREHHGA